MKKEIKATTKEELLLEYVGRMYPQENQMNIEELINHAYELGKMEGKK